MSTHEHWEELAAGYALDALEPQEQAEFADHLATCERCRLLVDEHSLVAAQLGSLAGDDVAPPPWSAIRAGIIGDASTQHGADVVALRRRRKFATTLAAAAAVAALVAGVTTWVATSRSGSQPLASAIACQQVSSCHVVALKTDAGEQADVLVNHDHVAVVPTGMPAPPAGSIWALWQVPRTGAPRLLTEFATGRHTASLPLPYDETAGFAVSKEPAGTTPSAPSDVVASGTVA